MNTLIKNLHIKNFKSVRDLSLDCDRINIFIGKPNAGKSNILEAISLLGAGYAEGRFMEGFIRYRAIKQLFSNFNLRSPVEIIANDVSATLNTSNKGSDFIFSINYINHVIDLNGSNFKLSENINIGISADGKIESNTSTGNRPSSIKKYEFQETVEYQDNGFFLHPPHGDNFYSIVESHPELRTEIQQFLKPNGLELLLDIESRRMAVVQKTDDTLLSFPIHLLPDTFKRYIFHLAAIMSNRDSVLLFEEPEAHSYAPYVYQLAQHILDDEGGNQYFITTHNPYFLLPIMQEGKDVAIFTTWFEDYQTHAHRLSEEEIREVLNYGIDMFLNLDHFIPA